MQKVHPQFITLEGGEGAGKSTQARRMVAWLEQRGHTVGRSRQPGGPAVAEDLRRLLKRIDGEPIAPVTELL
jgi:dTMP kinase